MSSSPPTVSLPCPDVGHTVTTTVHGGGRGQRHPRPLQPGRTVYDLETSWRRGPLSRGQCFSELGTNEGSTGPMSASLWVIGSTGRTRDLPVRRIPPPGASEGWKLVVRGCGRSGAPGWVSDSSPPSSWSRVPSDPFPRPRGSPLRSPIHTGESYSNCRSNPPGITSPSMIKK